MTLDEAIIHYRALGECKCEAARDKYRAGKMDLQFAEWLEELKALRAADEKNHMMFKESGDMWILLHELYHDMGVKLPGRYLQRIEDLRRIFEETA